jgi:hypothetical protein
MTTPPPPAAPRDWWVRPKVVLPVLFALVLLVALLTPEPDAGRVGDGRLSAHLSGPMGARAVADVARRFGWHVVLRDSTPAPANTPGTTVHAVLGAQVPITRAQAHRYLEAVRAGDALLLVIAPRTPLSDSLGLRFTGPGWSLAVPAADTSGCAPRGRELTPGLWADGRTHLDSLHWMRGRPADAITFAQVRPPDGTPADTAGETAAGFMLGKGRVIVVGDPDQLRNDVLRRCHWGADAVAMRMLEWLRAGGEVPRATLEFDEFHQGFGPRTSPFTVVLRFLGTHPVGRTMLQLVLAGLVLLVAAGPRAIVPAPRPRTQRRAPLEQADALAHAYQQVHATRTATLRLLRGVRARVERSGGLGRSRDDEQFLTMATRVDPARADDVALVQRALRAPRDSDKLPAIGAALRRIEDTLTTTTSSRA